MVEDYYNLKRSCLTPLVLNGKRVNIGDLSNKQLDITRRTLVRKKRLSVNEGRQLEAVRYVIKYRKEQPLNQLKEKVEHSYNQRLMTPKVVKTAEVITGWIKNSYK
jgi:hypothetical protein